MKLDQDALDEFKDFIVQSMNEDVYYQLKDWIDSSDITSDEYDKALDYFIANLHGSLQWVDTK